MARKSKARSSSRNTGSQDGAQAVRDSAQKIWLAGLGAFERAKTEGPRMFESLVEQGRNMGARAVGAADDVLKNMRTASYTGRWDKLEEVFEERVAKSLSRLGVMTTRDVEELTRQVKELNETVVGLMSGRAAGSRASSGGGRKGASRATGATRATGKSKARAKAAGSKAKAKRRTTKRPASE